MAETMVWIEKERFRIIAVQMDNLIVLWVLERIECRMHILKLLGVEKRMDERT